MNINSINPAEGITDHLNDTKTKMGSQLGGLAEVDVSQMSEKEKQAVREKCEDVEGLFIKMMMNEMRKSLNPASSGSKALDQGKDIYDEMLYDEYAKSMSRSGGIGIADMIYNQLTTPKVSAQEAIARYNKE